jgi:hypothetical protein
MASSTRCFRRPLTRTEPLRTLDTVPADTPARSATSRIVGRTAFNALSNTRPEKLSSQRAAVNAALQTVQVELYEAAAIDGANAWQKFRLITLPQPIPTIAFLLLRAPYGCRIISP